MEIRLKDIDVSCGRAQRLFVIQLQRASEEDKCTYVRGMQMDATKSV